VWKAGRADHQTTGGLSHKSARFVYGACGESPEDIFKQLSFHVSATIEL